MADFDTRYYKGTDQYSDGDEHENRLLELVKSGRTLDDLPVEEVSWPVLYHLHAVRENVCNWYPFRRGARILEIGSGCGAITGALCRTDCEVWSVELSRRRATINFERHRDCKNLHIVVGNLNDIPFDAPFDYVVLIGVLEYAGKYTGGDAPYRTFLKNVQRYMKPDGRLLIAIENRLGMKYFAGAPEDHLDRTFAGLKGYDPAEGVRTFSHGELEALLGDSGLGHTRFYYPYPDYKFPNEIFTDESLRPMHYGKYYSPLERELRTLFPEHEIASLLAAEGAGGLVANSFFVEAAFAPMEDRERVVYVKQNVERGPRTRIGTRIVADEKGEWQVYKYALIPEAGDHIDRIRQNEQTLGEYRDVLRGAPTERGLRYPFIRDMTMDVKLNDLIRKGRRDEVLALLDAVSELASVQPEQAEYASDAFGEWFGPERLEAPRPLCVRPANVDLILDNIFVTEGGYRLVDCEWVTDFPVPLGFILWRALRTAYFQYPSLESLVPRAELLRRFGIGMEDEKVYAAWAEHFESVYVRNKGLARFSKTIRVMSIDMRQIGEVDKEITRLREIEALNKEYIQGCERAFQSKSWKLAMKIQKVAKWLHLSKAE